MGINGLSPNAGTARIKKRIRDLERLLRKPGLAATKKTEAERAVASFKRELDVSKRRNTEIKNSRKYHMVKFVEKKKAIRALKKPDAGDEQLAAYYYITHYPRDRKYQALYATEAATPESHKFLAEIHRQMDSGELPKGEETIKEILASSTI